MITLQKLIMVTPFSEEVKTDLLGKVDTFSDDEKRDLYDMCWNVLSEWYHNEVDQRYESAILEMAEGKKTYTKEELGKIPDTFLSEFTNKLQEAATVEDIKEVREKLEDVKEKVQQQ